MNIILTKRPKKGIGSKKKYINNNKKSYRKYMIKFTMLFSLISYVLSVKSFHLVSFSNKYEISLKVVGTGTQNILNSGFYKCPSKIYINGVIQNTNNCYQVNVIEQGSTIKLIWDNPLTSTSNMFSGLEDISEIDLSNFDTSLVTDMSRMFGCCHSLELLDLSNLNTQNVKTMNDMFDHLNSLTSLNLWSFNTSNVTDMGLLFERTNSLQYINMRNFNEAKNPSISNMFKEITNTNMVIYLNPDKAPNINNLARSLGFTVVTYEYEYQGKCIENCPQNTFVYKYRCYSKCNNYYYFDVDDNYICLNISKCPEFYDKFIPSKNQCIDNCEKDDVYKFELRDICYDECPINISYPSNSINYFCEVNCSKEMPLEIIKEQKCTNTCSVYDMDNKNCISKYKDDDTNANLILENIKENILSSDFINENNLYNNTKEIIIKEEHVTFMITNYEIDKNISEEILNDIEKNSHFLKNYYNITNVNNLILFIINVQQKEKGYDKTVYEI